MTEGAGPYRVMSNRPVLSEGSVVVRAVEPEHIEAIRCWRNAQIDVLRQSRAITAEEQAAYFERVIWPDKGSDRPANILLGLFEHGRMIGYGGLVHIAWDYGRAEVSFLLATEIAQDEAVVSILFATWLRQMQKLAFDDLGLSRLTTETYAMRALHLRILDEAGFHREGLLRQHVRVDGRPMDAVVHGCLASDAVRPG
jgi:Acetyltransferases, including N-acetylases of ribosomal proteins